MDSFGVGGGLLSSSGKERFSPVTSSIHAYPTREVWDNDRHGRKYTGFLGTIHEFFIRQSTVAGRRHREF